MPFCLRRSVPDRARRSGEYNAMMLRHFLILIGIIAIIFARSTVASSAAVEAAVPDTPAGKMFSGWLTAFNMGQQDSATEGRIQRIEALLRTAQSRGQFNGVALIGEKGRILYRNACGYANFAQQTPMRPDTSFELASVSKPFTALAIMMLKERGKLSYDDRLTRYFPELPYPGVTIRHMLTHTAGLPEPEPFFGDEWPAGKPVTNAVFVERLAQRKTPAYFAPGEQWKYDRTAYLLLARIVEIVSGTSYEGFLHENIFKPLGMHGSFVINTQRMGEIAHLAQGYIYPLLWSDDYVVQDTLPRYRYTRDFGDTAGPMGVYSSAVDLFKWVQALNHGKLIKQQTLAEAYTPVQLNNGSVPGAGGGAGNDIPSHYGYGWFLEEGPDGKTVRHTGDWRGCITCVIHNLKRDQTIIVLTNTTDFAAIDLANAIENILNNHPYTLPQMSVGRLIGKTIFTKGIETAIRQYHELKTTQPTDYDFQSDSELNTLGYQLLRQGNTKAAIAVFNLNVEAFPTEWNVYDSLGEAYLADGNRELAIKNYRRSVALNPANRSGVDTLAKLGAE
jgi:CubicO group peptidase (beta-lactamase class C family)